MTRGRPTKKSKNITGLCNQRHSSDSASCTVTHSRAPSPDESDSTWLIFQDSLKADVARFEEGADDSDEVEEQSDWGELDDEDFASHAAAMVLDDDPKDKEWVPEWLLRKREKQRSSQTCEHRCFLFVF